jgi:hypothetical protein
MLLLQNVSKNLKKKKKSLQLAAIQHQENKSTLYSTHRPFKPTYRPTVEKHCSQQLIVVQLFIDNFLFLRNTHNVSMSLDTSLLKDLGHKCTDYFHMVQFKQSNFYINTPNTAMHISQNFNNENQPLYHELLPPILVSHLVTENLCMWLCD